MAYGTVRVDYITTSTQTLDIDTLGSTDLSYTASTRELASSSGSNVTLPEATTTNAGLLSSFDKGKLDGIAAGAEVNVQADWDATSGDALILNKPTLGTAAATDSTAYATAAQGSTADSALQPSDNISELTNDSGYITSAGAPVQSVAGKTGTVTLVKGDVGLGNVDNTSDADKPVSTATQSALDLKAPLASPALTGTPTAPTAVAGTNTTQVATTAFVSSAVANIVDAAPAALDTLNELAAALGDDANFSTTITTSIGTKLSLSGGEMTGNITFSGAQTVDGRDLSVDGAKLDGIAAGATNVTNNNQLTNGAGYITSSDNITGNAATATTATTASTANALNTGNDYQVNSLGVGTAASGTAGEIRATNDITAYYSSDINLKKDVELISEPIEKLKQIRGVAYSWNEEYLKEREVDGYFVREREIGVIAQEVEGVLPEIVATRDDGYKAVRYERLVALLIEAVKDQQVQIDELKSRIEG